MTQIGQISEEMKAAITTEALQKLNSSDGSMEIGDALNKTLQEQIGGNYMNSVNNSDLSILSNRISALYARPSDLMAEASDEIAPTATPEPSEAFDEEE